MPAPTIIVGNAYYDLGQYRKSIADQNSALRLNPKFANAYNNRGIAYQALKKYRKALADYERALAIDPGLKIALRIAAGSRENGEWQG